MLTRLRLLRAPVPDPDVSLRPPKLVAGSVRAIWSDFSIAFVAIAFINYSARLLALDYTNVFHENRIKPILANTAAARHCSQFLHAINSSRILPLNKIIFYLIHCHSTNMLFFQLLPVQWSYLFHLLQIVLIYEYVYLLIKSNI